MIINDKRALAYTAKVEWVKPIEGADNIELIGILGWTCIAKIGEFHPGDQCVYFEIDSKVPVAEWSAFLESKHYKIKTMKLGKFGVYSQGLALPFDAFDANLLQKITDATTGGEEHVDLTDIIGVTYAVEEDNKRKSNTVDPEAKYMSMKARHKKFFSKKIVKKFMKYKWFRKFIFIFLGKKKDKPRSFPNKFEFVNRTDESRCENLPWVIGNKDPWIKTTKIDGSSETLILERKGKNKFEKYVCSRNVRQLTPSQANYHKDIDGNVYWMMADKYKIFDFLKDYLIKNNLEYACLQGEVAGPSIQGNPHKFKELCFFGFNLIRSDVGRINSVEAKNICAEYDIPWVPIVDENYIIPDTMEEFKLSADGPCEALGAKGLREGYVYRSLDGKTSFKNVSREYLLKHNM